MKANMRQGFGLGVGFMGAEAAAYMVFVLWIAFFIGGGFLIVRAGNKKGTKLTKSTTPLQYPGYLLMIIGILPILFYLLPYIIMGFVGEELDL